ncbi:MAG: class I SAM-dependent methyltransferase [Actinobacteria bacterium]|nr:class I SAM-dependent methyltransferase [Actinomycetota bacterium]
MMGHPDPTSEQDPVVRSVAAYSNEPQAYADHYAHHLLDRPHRFAASLPAAARILDLGCGPGRDLRIFAALGHRPIGLELNLDFVELARHQGDVVVGDIRAVSTLFPPASFDGVWAQASLVHLSTDETAQALADLHALLVPGGHCYACVSVTGATGWLDEPDGRRWYTVWPDESFLDAVRAAGFEITDITRGPYIEVWATKV